MRNRIFIALAALLMSFSISSCKKDNSTSPTLVGKWKVSRIVLKESGTTIESYTGLSTDFIEFKSNGIYEYSVDGDVDLGSYEIIGNAVFIDDEEYKIQNLTNSNVTLFLEEDDENYETTIYLKK